MGNYNKSCSQCGERLEKGEAIWQSPALCQKCRDKLLGEMRDARPVKRVFPADWTFDDKVDKARELGISYGQFQARAYDGQYDMKTLKKADRKKIVRGGYRDLIYKIRNQAR